MNPQNARPPKAYKPISKPIVATGIASTVVIGSGAFVLSFSALTDLAVRAGINPEIGWMWPLIVDGMIVAATVAIVALAGREGKEQFYPWILLFFGAVVSTAANSIHAILAVQASHGNVPVVVSALVAAMPPVVLLAITHLTVLLVQYARNSAEMLASLAAEADQAQLAVEGERPADGIPAAASAAPDAGGSADAASTDADTDSAVGGVAVVEEALAETAPDAAAPAPKPKAAPKRKPSKPATASAPPGAAAKPTAARTGAKSPVAKRTPAPSVAAATPAGARPAAKGSGSSRQLMPELSTVTAVNPLLRPPQSAEGMTGMAAIVPPAPQTTVQNPAGQTAEPDAGSEDASKELVSAQG
ncbi:hypothetical protein SCMU_39590 [Sinomonas cyclohexanicum]|uniref:DUF2637 domain-containing protein n=1 Tax=Sinomonas cyclohexanicum TaxID=322009 RepID=A0ABN6FRR9_SINCY|nr:DUF2637 domain-containing protein [Corynebacterium cyclohexanicum]BCT78117.1 hypothetical protein SCMU_39590 [Corynebacterium cyclohexanicum]